MKKKERIPPGQKLVPKERFPVLHYASVPKVDLSKFALEIYGHIENHIVLSWSDLMKLPRAKVKTDFHCVTGWSVLDLEWEGIPFLEIYKLAKPKDDAKYVMFRSLDGYKTNVPLDLLLRDDVILAYKLECNLLSPEHGGPLRVVVPHLYGWKSAKWVSGIEFMTKNKLGFWESRGYHPIGDPWKEERYWQ